MNNSSILMIKASINILYTHCRSLLWGEGAFITVKLNNGKPFPMWVILIHCENVSATTK